MFRINQINIRQFGRFSDKKIQLPGAPFLIVYGPNETGKSTLTAFIKYMMFGFPAKAKMDAFIKNEDVNHVGGSLSFESDQFGELKLERFLNRSGAPQVYGNNGRDKLNRLFHGLDLSTYESIFCFDLDGLKGLEKVGAKEMNQLLFSAGMTGNARILRLEQMLDKKLSELFKPSGRKPVINQTLTKLDQLRDRLKQWDKKLDYYYDIQENIQHNETEIKKTLEKKQELENMFHQFTLFSSIKPLIRSYRSLREEEKLLLGIRFPEEGLERFNKWQAQIIALEGEKAEIAKRIEQTSQVISQLSIDRLWLDNERKLLNVINKASFYESLYQNIDMTKEKMLYEEKLLDNLMNKLGNNWTREAVCTADISIEAKDHLKQLLHERNRALDDKDRLEQAMNESMVKSKHIQEQIAKSQQHLLDETQRQQIEEQLHAGQNKEMLEKEKRWLEEKASSIRQGREQKERIKKLSVIIPVSCIFLSVLLAFLQIHNHDKSGGLIFAVFGVMLSIGIGLVINKTGDKLYEAGQEEEINRQLEAINQRLSAKPEGELYEPQAILDKDEETRTSITLLTERLKDEKKFYENLIHQLDHVTLVLETSREQLREWAERHGFMESSASVIEEVYQYVEDAKTHLLQQEQYQKQLNDRREQIAIYEKEKQQLADELRAENDDVWFLEQRLAQEKEKHQKYVQLNLQLQGLTEQEEALNEKVARYRAECERLMQMADVNNEESFREKAKQHEKKKQIERQMVDLKRQMEQMVPNRTFLKQCDLWLKEGRFEGVTEEGMKQEIAKLERHLESSRKQQLKWQSERSQLEENQSYANLNHQLEAGRSFLNEKARQWAVYQTAKALLYKAKEEYREHKLPAVLTKAAKYFSQMTDFKYKDIYMSDDKGLAVESEGGQSFYVKELSRGTAEQLYVSIRLALASVFESAEGIPIIIDDSFVNFDNHRSRQVMNVLSEVSKRHQIILMTCHKEYMNYSDAVWFSLAP
ncbi:AAA family ATPase [Scopulibacillus cellulosilyticus]|uniref:AAA family ATPase n=1 Tax=Scopulibacillus cellulosilyticus TaxID=2665665 RepID=A0ABW2PQH7_9BACL